MSVKVSGLLQPFKDLPAGQGPLELPHKLFQVVRHDPIEVDQVTVDVVQDFHVSRVAGKVHRRSTGKDLHVATMVRKAFQEQIDQAAFASDPGHDWVCHGFQLLALQGALVRCSWHSAD